VPILDLTADGLYCAAGDFHVDPWRPVARAVITHGHADHARWGSSSYLAAAAGAPIFKTRLGTTAPIQFLPYGEQVRMGDATVSLHPAGHIPGSAQVRIEVAGEVMVVSGDYKTEPDPTCTPFEPVKCHTFVTESTFGLPIYRWRPQSEIFAQINAWWRANQEAGRASLLYGYALGKAQRMLAGVDPTIGPICSHGAVFRLNRDYRELGIPLPDTCRVLDMDKGTDWSRFLVIAPPSAHGTPWMRRFGAVSTAFASGWMQVRGTRRRRAVDRGFVLSDHVDWPALLQTIEATGAEEVWVTHGYTTAVTRWLNERGIRARALETRFEGEADDLVDETLEEQPAEAPTGA
jgi:putative mRNA 3-end processing factor